MMDHNTIYERLEDAVESFTQGHFAERYSLHDYAALIRIRAEEFEKLAKAGKTEEATVALKKTFTMAMLCAIHFGIPKELP